MSLPLFGIHDATTGFHDVKPLPAFAPIDWLFVALVALAVALLLCLALYRRKLRAASVPTPIPPHKEAEAEIRSLRDRAQKNNITIRELGTSASTIIRTYFEKRLHFPATDETSNEVLRNLESALSQHHAGNEALAGSTDALRFFDYLTFSDDSERRFEASHQEVIQRIDLLGSIVSQVENELTPSEGIS